jgi:hypothetical protein
LPLWPVGEDHFPVNARKRRERALDRAGDVALFVERLDDDADVRTRVAHDAVTE